VNLPILIIIVIAYLAVISYFGYKGYAQTKNSADYLVGGRTIHPYEMAMSYGATFISTSAIVGFGGIASLYGMSIIWLAAANVVVGIFIAFVCFGKRTRKMGLYLDAHTFPEFLGRRVGSRFVQGFSGLIIFVFMPVYAAAVLIGASRILESLLGIPYAYSVAIFSVLVAAYVIVGGLKGIMYTEALQGTLMLAGMFFLLVFIYIKVGGPSEGHRALTALSPLAPESLVAAGHRGYTSSPEPGSPLWWTIYSSLVLGVGIGVLAQPQLVVRYMTVKSNKELNRAVLIGGFFIFATVGTTYIVGPLSNVFFYQRTGMIAIDVAGGNADKVIPLLIRDAMPSWFGYIFMLVILSAAMSTMSSQFHTVGTAAGRDVYEYGIRNGRSKAGAVLITRVGIGVSIILSVFLSFELGESVIARATSIFFGIMASGFLAPYTAAVYWRRLTRKGAIAGILGGLCVSCFAFLFLHTKESSVFGLCMFLTGRQALIPGMWGDIDPLVYALPASILCTVLVSLNTRVEYPKTVEACFKSLR